MIPYVRIIATQNSPIILAASNIVDLKPLEDPRDFRFEGYRAMFLLLASGWN